MMEPQGREGLALSLTLFCFNHLDKVYLHIANERIKATYGGMASLKSLELDNVDNVGAYLTAYLGRPMDLEVVHT